MPKGFPKNGINKGWFKKGNRALERKIRNCLVCQKEFQTHPCFIKNGQGRFCSIPCAKKAVSLGLVKHTLSPNAHKKMSEMMKGNKFALGLGGKKHWNWKGGRPKCIDCKKQLGSYSSIRCHSCSGKYLSEENSPVWRGAKGIYRSLHRWVEKHLGHPDTCKHCGRSNLSGHLIHWANKSHKYKRDLEDWLRLCVKCHKKYDVSIS